MAVGPGDTMDVPSIDLTSEQGVASLMEQSRTAKEWDANCLRVKAANGDDYPDFWWRVIQESGLSARVHARWE